MNVTVLTVHTEGLYEWGKGMDKKAHDQWIQYWKSYDAPHWGVLVDSSDTVYLVSEYGGGKVHPSGFSLVLNKAYAQAKSEIEVLSATFKELSEILRFDYTMTAQESTYDISHAESHICSVRSEFRKPKTEEEAAAAELPSAGMGPYRAALSRISDGTVVWESGTKFTANKEAHAAIIAEANARRLRVTGYSRHWVTEKHEHVIDFGSHSFYGVITQWDDAESKKARAKADAAYKRREKAEQKRIARMSEERKQRRNRT